MEGQRFVDVCVPPELRDSMHAALLGADAADTPLRVHTSDKRLLEIHFRVTRLAEGGLLDAAREAAGLGGGSDSCAGDLDGVLAVGVDVTPFVGKAAAALQARRTIHRCQPLPTAANRCQPLSPHALSPGPHPSRLTACEPARARRRRCTTSSG